MTKLNEYDIQYQPQTTIKVQTLADFFAETSGGEEGGVWKIFMDGSTTCKGSVVGVLLVSPQGDEIRVVVQLCFKASNNKV